MHDETMADSARSGAERWIWPVVWAVALAASIALLVLSSRTVSERHLRDAAERTAIDYAHLIGAAVPDLKRLLEHGVPSPDTLARLERLREAGSVFRFKLFDREGDLLLVSDQLDEPGFGADGGRLGAHHDVNKKTLVDDVLGGRPHVELEDGRAKADRPDRYSEAYVPLVAGGRVAGVVEVYVDQTLLAEQVRRSFLVTSLVVVAVTLLLGVLGIVQLVRRLERQRRAERRMRYLARHDVLSGALNRASFSDVLSTAVRRHERNGKTFAVLCIDLDRFKEVNDTLGHAAGDEVLRQATARLGELLRHGDRLARLGGDEFAILQADVADTDGVSTLAERVVERLAAPYRLDDGEEVVCGGSVGAAVFGIDATVLAELMHKADLALYRAKTNGRGGFSFYDAELDGELRTRRALTADLRRAVDEEALTLNYQKLFDADGKRVVGHEALLRWHHPEHGNVPPDVFIAIAEDGGMIERLGGWVLHRACREAVRWPDGQSVAVNLSAAQFRQGDLVATVNRALAESGLPPERLELEITESLLMSDTDPVIETLNALAALGVRIAMDDFGTGYSSLAYLWRFPFHKLKIDKSFTHALENDGKVDLIVRSIVSLAHSLQIRVNAEGVETADQLAALQRHGCDEFQGFLLGRPASVESMRRESAPVPPASGEARPRRDERPGDDGEDVLPAPG